jgi:hypothetical protein
MHVLVGTVRMLVLMSSPVHDVVTVPVRSAPVVADVLYRISPFPPMYVLSIAPASTEEAGANVAAQIEELLALNIRVQKFRTQVEHQCA